MKPQLDHCGNNKRKITNRKERTNLIRKNCKEIWEYISEREEVGKEWSVWFPIAMTNNRLRWVLGTRKRSLQGAKFPLHVSSEVRHSSVLTSQWKKFYSCYYKREKFTGTMNEKCLAHLKYVLDSGYPIYNERVIKVCEAIGHEQCRMFSWRHDLKGCVYWDTLLQNTDSASIGSSISEVYESFMNVVMSDTLDHAL